LGQAYSPYAMRNFTGAPFTNTWYHQALANQIAGRDLDTAHDDIVARFNSSIDTGCFGSVRWYYGTDHNEGGNADLLAVVLHEIGHGLGYSTFIDPSTGAQQVGSGDLPDVFSHDAGMAEHRGHARGRRGAVPDDGSGAHRGRG